MHLSTRDLAVSTVIKIDNIGVDSDVGNFFIVLLIAANVGRADAQADVVERGYKALTVTTADNETHRAVIVGAAADEGFQISLYLKSNSYGFFRSLSFPFKANSTQRADELISELRMHAYWFGLYTLRIAVTQDGGALPFFEVSVERDSSGYPDGLSLARGTAITHSPDVIDVAHPYILVQDSTEGYSSIDLLNGNTGKTLLSTVGFDHELFPQAVTLLTIDDRLIVRTSCLLDRPERDAEFVFADALRCECAPGDCDASYEYRLDLGGLLGP